ncbi:NADPH-dependent FMN reductase [Paraflavitalea pollutisoli]|uniref:NADPH-dependent FMN reductase n=1 Tax=Paraflavitalea pollutisoli TaxID=3034143 RepID=UPI0023EAD1FF|nr:NADPH-dependent FMN reductase [Paraflavitalea sp. H1-2-19X]
MTKPVHILAISGSTRQQSTNQVLIDIIADRFADAVQVVHYEGLAQLPHFNPDLDGDAPPAAVVDFRDRVHAADGVLICTPEYAMGVPGTLKNAIDWVVGSMEFSGKPVALITAASMGEQAHQSLVRTLLVIEASMPESSRLLIPFVKAKVRDGVIVDETTNGQVNAVVESLIAAIR